MDRQERHLARRPFSLSNGAAKDAAQQQHGGEIAGRRKRVNGEKSHSGERVAEQVAEPKRHCPQTGSDTEHAACNDAGPDETEQIVCEEGTRPTAMHSIRFSVRAFMLYRTVEKTKCLFRLLAGGFTQRVLGCGKNRMHLHVYVKYVAR
jgi:hypothetical protein